MVLNGRVLENKDVLSGVRHESVLGPLLFVLLIFEVPHAVSGKQVE